MNNINCYPKTDATVMLTWLNRSQYYLSMEYQRESDIWPLEKRQLLIDSIINGFDIPKLYIHEFETAKIFDGNAYKFGVIDGKQRLKSIWQFMNNEWPLSDEIEYIENKNIDLKKIYYNDLLVKYPLIHYSFTGYPLSIICIRTNDPDLIEDMFSRLNEAIPLNAPEKRNAFGGPVPPAIRKLVKNKFFTSNIKIRSTRYKHLDLACKILYVAYKKGPADTKKIHLDKFVKQLKAKPQTTGRNIVKELEEAVLSILNKMSNIFKQKDPLLTSAGMIILYFLAIHENILSQSDTQISRKMLVNFNNLREKNREDAEKDISKADYELLEFDRLAQTPNDMSAISFRLGVLKKYMKI